jgi:hypothetical protein
MLCKKRWCGVDSEEPLLVSLINQLVMVAAGVDSDLFDDGAPDNNDGNALANLTYRITAFYSGRDSVLTASAGLKHFGMRRLGRTGLSSRAPLADPSSPTDNVWDGDCSGFFPRLHKLRNGRFQDSLRFYIFSLDLVFFLAVKIGLLQSCYGRRFGQSKLETRYGGLQSREFKPRHEYFL